MLVVTLAAVLECLRAAEPAQAADAPPVMDERAEALRTIIVRTTPVTFAALKAELAPRWPEGELLEVGADAFARVEGTRFSYLEIVGEPVGSAPVEITLILSDGRAYVRRSAVLGDDRARALAIAIANLLGAVADEEVPPDRTDAEIPGDVDDTATPVEPPRDPEPVVPKEVIAEPERIPVAPRPWQLGLHGGAGVLVGLAPEERRVRPTAAGGLRLSLLAPIGVAVGTSLRLAGQGSADHRLTRIRIALDVGYVGRVRAFEWAVGVGPTIEPWVVTSSGQRSTLGRTDSTGAPLLYGGALFVSVGYRIMLPRAGPLSSLRIGATTELAASVLGTGSSARVVLPSDAGDTDVLFSLGGLELSIGADVTLWFDLRRR